MKGLSKRGYNFLIMGGGLFILLLIAYTIIRSNNEGFQQKNANISTGGAGMFVIFAPKKPPMLRKGNNLVNGCPPKSRFITWINGGAVTGKGQARVKQCVAANEGDYSQIIKNSSVGAL